MTPLAMQVWDNPAGEALKAQIPTGRFALPEEIAVLSPGRQRCSEDD